MSDLWHLCLDLGGTGSRAALFDDAGAEIGRTTGGPGAVSLGTETTLPVVRALWAVLVNGRPEARTTVTIGLAGIGLRDRVAALAAALGDFARVTIVGDGYGALLSATGGRPGALVAVGTGVAAMRQMPDGRTRTLSGWGFPAGDLGSGAWIGLQAVTALTRHVDGLSALTAPFAEALSKALGGTAGAIMDRTAAAPAHAFAALVPLVLAAQADSHAQSILDRAAAEIAAVGRALWDGGPGDVHLTGGLAAALAPRIRAVGGDMAWHLTSADPLVGLSLLARGRSPTETLVSRPGLATPDY